MKTEFCPFGGWNRNLSFSNEQAEMIVTLDVGPRIISYRMPGKNNIFKNYEEQLGGSEEGEWMIRGGHRLWLAPEDLAITYALDNVPIIHKEEVDGFVVFTSKQETPVQISKELGVRMDEVTSRVEIRHTAKNEGAEPIQIASWGLSVMQPGGLAILPQPPMGNHPTDLLPNRNLILWPYTDMTDPRLHFGQKFITLQQSVEFPPTKFGLAHRSGWAAYLWEDSLFIKSFGYEEGANYPDFGCNFETFTNKDMLEMETLSPLVDLVPGAAVTHNEIWNLFPLDEELQLESEDALSEWLAPFLVESGIL